jgi:hypothetical protein
VENVIKGEYIAAAFYGCLCFLTPCHSLMSFKMEKALDKLIQPHQSAAEVQQLRHSFCLDHEMM